MSTADCYRCSRKHHATKCSFKEYMCHACKKKGHLARMCHSRKGQPSHINRTVPSPVRSLLQNVRGKNIQHIIPINTSPMRTMKRTHPSSPLLWNLRLPPVYIIWKGDTHCGYSEGTQPRIQRYESHNFLHIWVLHTYNGMIHYYYRCFTNDTASCRYTPLFLTHNRI